MRGMPNMGKLMKQAQQMQTKMAEIQEDMKKMRCEGQAGGGAIKAVLNGNNEVLEITISPEVVDPEDVEMLQDLVLAAIRGARQQSDAQQQEAMKQVTGGMGLPPGMGI
ncbi:MAG: YbaB/EbfC family nucleoid-associated protein [Gemmatimonadetes bacterium]|nr:YbaB/EbfC family nucleoid-associated protein [Gemmatimonadota bacterium]